MPHMPKESEIISQMLRATCGGAVGPNFGAKYMQAWVIANGETPEISFDGMNLGEDVFRGKSGRQQHRSGRQGRFLSISSPAL